jgi:hypothetical protein
MVYGKCTTNKWRSTNSCSTPVEHEFLLIHDFRHPTQHHAVAVLILDRASRTDCTENHKGSSRSVGQASVVSRDWRNQQGLNSPSVSQVAAKDTIATTLKRFDGRAIIAVLLHIDFVFLQRKPIVLLVDELLEHLFISLK